jgi:ubiquitin-activating enzyme E1 C
MGRIQDKDEDYYSQFQIVICGLDSIEARRWINAMLVSLVDDESPESLIPMVDGGTEGKQLNGTHCRLLYYNIERDIYIMT